MAAKTKRGATRSAKARKTTNPSVGKRTDATCTTNRGSGAASTTNRHAGTTPTAKRRATAAAPGRNSRTGSRWSAQVMRQSDAMDLKEGIFKQRSPRQIALQLKRSAEASTRRKSPPFRSAMSMLNFEINRGGSTLSVQRRRVLNQAKDELRKLYHRQPKQASRASK